MKKKTIFGLLIGVALITGSCVTVETKSGEDAAVAPQTETTETVAISADSVVMAVNAWREKIEALTAAPVEVSTAELREKTRQKWSKIHFYADNGMVVKVKTYPHEGVSKRTEEFYANADGLVLVVIEDDGEGPKGKAEGDIDKMYYFSSGKLVKEVNKGGEQEFNIRNSDSEELLTEFNEYLDIYNRLPK